MCGICGFTGDGTDALLACMTSTLMHRGPDEEGLWRNHHAALGMRRLAIIDPESGQQPVFNEEANVVCVFNGEIYNHVALRRDLEQKGHRFRSHHSDSEVIVHLYETYGTNFPSHLNGMFAIALWDDRIKTLLLVRDHAGIKPLYYAALSSGRLVFGSEPKALLAHPDVSRDPDLVAIHHYFSLKNVPAPFSAFQDMRQLRPGEMALFKDGALQILDWRPAPLMENIAISEDEAARHIRQLLEESVRRQMRSDVPFAAYLSGGVDSSTVVAMMSRLAGFPIETFTLVYEDDFKNKSADQMFAREVSRMYGTRHHEHLVTYRDVARQMDRILTAFDEPFSGVISTFFITEAISQHVKVALSGDGADELFGSYLPHRLAQPLAFLDGHPGGSANPGEPPSEALAPFANQLAFLERIRKRGDESSRRMGQYICDDATKQELYTPKMQAELQGASTRSLIARELAACPSGDPLNRMLHLDRNTLLPDQVLAFVDRLSMAHSVEVRPPFLDPHLMEFAATLPGHMKIKNGRVKHILKEAVADLLPEGVVDRPKEGFLMPINEWIITRLRSEVEERLSPRRLQRHGLLREEGVARLLADHFAGHADHGNRIWNLMMFQSWWDRSIFGDAP